MRITIVEAEIKEAIVSYVESQMTIKEGQEITVDFKATRGEDGATAEINIVAASKQVTTATPVKRTPRAKPVETSSESVQEKGEESGKEVYPTETVQDSYEAQDAVAETTVTEEQVTDVSAEVVPAEVATEVQAEPAEEAPKTTGSLFSSLKRPSND